MALCWGHAGLARGRAAPAAASAAAMRWAAPAAAPRWGHRRAPRLAAAPGSDAPGGSKEPEESEGSMLAREALSRAMMYRATRAAQEEAKAAAAAQALIDGGDDEEDDELEGEEGETGGFPWQDLEEDDADVAAEGWAPMNSDDELARELGLSSVDDMSPSQQMYKDKLLRKVAERRAAAAAANLEGETALNDAVEFFKLGRYRESAEVIQKALTTISPGSALGGKLQLWLGQALDAGGRKQEAIDLYAKLEADHPIRNIKKQAADLRFITEAPVLRLGEDERVQVPVLESMDRYVDRSGAALPIPAKRSRKYTPSLEEQFLENYRPPSLEVNYYVLVASAVLLAGLAYWSSVRG